MFLQQHCGLIVTDSNGEGVFFHASNNNGHWRLEEKDPAQPEKSFSLVALVLVSKVDDTKKAMEMIRTIPADGKPFLRTGEAFHCRTWVKDALCALKDGEIIELPTDIGELAMFRCSACTNSSS